MRLQPLGLPSTGGKLPDVRAGRNGLLGDRRDQADPLGALVEAVGEGGSTGAASQDLEPRIGV